jgi:hypothetical protein
MPECRVLDELLRHDSLDVGGLVEQRVIFHEMISAAPLHLPRRRLRLCSTTPTAP